LSYGASNSDLIDSDIRMKRKDPKIAITEIESLENIFLQCRSVFPALSESLIGQTDFETAPFYVQRGYKVQIKTSTPITKNFLEQNNVLVKWLNENAIIRLFGIMNYYGLLEKIDKTLSGSREVDLMRRMRNAFTKTGLNYRPEQPDNMRLREEVIQTFQLSDELNEREEIPTPIDKVVLKIFRACRQYIEMRIAIEK
jgi:hypothetical protein